MNRRTLCQTASAAALCGSLRARNNGGSFKLNYLVSSAMYGTTALHEVLPEIHKTGTSFIDIWPRPHANHREQVAMMGLAKFEELLSEHKIKLGVLTQYKLGPFGLASEFPVAQRFGCQIIVCGAAGNRAATGTNLRSEVKKFIERMKPHADAAAEHGVTIAVENHSGQILATPDGIKWFTELATHPNLALAFAPHHLPQNAEMQGRLLAGLGGKVAFFYGQQHGTGSSRKQPREKELLQMPGRGPLDFTPLLQGLKSINFTGFTEPFMHPFPRGIPIHNSTAGVTAEIKRSRSYLEKCLQNL
ncbi:MAG: sugar phosphate isomerase/epimerase [Roseibacillus sp.]|nr:sugar phosphate isomerase/epimerase [Roseibacillus sp.]